MATEHLLYGPDGRPIASGRDPIEVWNQNWQTWTIQWGDFVENPDRLRIRDYERMYETDETVFSGVEFLTQSILGRLSDYTHKNPTIEAFVRANLCQMEGSFIHAAGEMLSGAVVNGWTDTEIIWRKKNSQVWLRGLQTLYPGSLTLDYERDGLDKNKLKRVWQWFRQANQAELLPSKVVHYAHDSRYGNLYGKSRLKRAYKNWFIKDVLLPAMGLSMERYGQPYTVGSGDLSRTVNDGGTMKPYPQYLAEQLDKLGKTGSLIVDEKTKVELIYAANGLGRDHHDVIGYLNRSIHQAIGLPSLIADSGSVGSYSLGQQHFEQFVLLLEQIFVELTEVLIDQLIRPLILLNYGEQDDYGSFLWEDTRLEDQAALATTVKTLADGGFLDPSRLEDQNWVRERMGAPLVDEEDLQPSMPEEDPTLPPPPPEEDVPSQQFSLVGKRRAWMRGGRRRLAAGMADRMRAKGVLLPLAS